MILAAPGLPGLQAPDLVIVVPGQAVPALPIPAPAGPDPAPAGDFAALLAPAPGTPMLRPPQASPPVPPSVPAPERDPPRLPVEPGTEAQADPPPDDPASEAVAAAAPLPTALVLQLVPEVALLPDQPLVATPVAAAPPAGAPWPAGPARLPSRPAEVPIVRTGHDWQASLPRLLPPPVMAAPPIMPSLQPVTALAEAPAPPVPPPLLPPSVALVGPDGSAITPAAAVPLPAEPAMVDPPALPQGPAQPADASPTRRRARPEAEAPAAAPAQQPPSMPLPPPLATTGVVAAFAPSSADIDRAEAAAEPTSPTETAAADLAVASDRLGQVAVRMRGGADGVEVALQAQSGVSMLIAGEAPRLREDMAAAGVVLAGLSVNGQRADLSGNGRRGQRSQQDRLAALSGPAAIADRKPPLASHRPIDRFA